MNISRRGFLGALAALTAVPALAKIPFPEKELPKIFKTHSGPVAFDVSLVTKPMPGVSVYVNGVFVPPSEYTVDKKGTGQYSLTFNEPLADSQQAVFIVQGNPGELAYIAPKATGADIRVEKFG